MTARRSILAALAAALLAGLGACGGDSGSKSQPEANAKKGTVPIATFIRRADALCTAGRNDARKVLRPLVKRLQADGSLSQDDVMKVNEIGADAARPLQRRLDALQRPSTKFVEVDAYLKANDDTLEAADKAVAAYRRGDAAATTRALSRNRSGGAVITRTARAVGFKSCGNEFSLSGGN
jgi:hypothetical protein